MAAVMFWTHGAWRDRPRPFAGPLTFFSGLVLSYLHNAESCQRFPRKDKMKNKDKHSFFGYLNGASPLVEISHDVFETIFPFRHVPRCGWLALCGMLLARRSTYPVGNWCWRSCACISPPWQCREHGKGLHSVSTPLFFFRQVFHLFVFEPRCFR